MKGIRWAKAVTPISRVKMGVNAFMIPASDESIRVSAMQNRKAGKNVPRIPDRKISPHLSLGIRRNDCMPKGIKTTPALMILTEATCQALRSFNPSFMITKELPQVMHSRMNSNQLIQRFLNSQDFCKVPTFRSIHPVKSKILSRKLQVGYGYEYQFIDYI